MSGFVSFGPTASVSDEDVISNDGWWPDLSMANARDAMRIDSSITDFRLREALRYAMAGVNDQLSRYAADAQAQGADTLAQVSSHQLDGQSRLLMLYRRAVHCMAKADLMERYRDYDSSDSGLRKVADMSDAIDEQRRNAHWAVRDLQGQPRTTVELI